MPLNSRLDPTELVLTQLERFAPGIRDRVIAVHATPAADRAQRNPAEIGGDILGGSFTLGQALRRPVVSRAPWRTPLPGVYPTRTPFATDNPPHSFVTLRPSASGPERGDTDDTTGAAT